MKVGKILEFKTKDVAREEVAKVKAQESSSSVEGGSAGEQKAAREAGERGCF